MSDLAHRLPLIRRTGGNVIAVASSQLVGKIATLAWLLVATRSLDQSAFGLFSFALALSLLIGSLVEWGFTAAMVQRASKNPATLNSAYTAAQAWQLGLGIPAYSLVVLVCYVQSNTSGIGLILLATAVATMAETWCSTARSAASVLQRQGRVAIAVVLQRLIITGCVIGALLVSGTVAALAVAFLVGTILGVPIHSLALRRAGIRLSVEGLRLSALYPLLFTSYYIGLAGVVLVGLAKLDQVFLGVLADDAAVGAYAAAYRLLETVFFVAFALNAALFPLLSADPRATVVHGALRGAWAVLCLVYVPYAVVCLLTPAPLLRVLFGHPYDRTAASSLQWLAVVPILFSGAFLLSAALMAVEKQRAILRAALGALVVTVVGDLLLIPPYGPAGAAATTAAGYGVQMVVAAANLRCVTGLPPTFLSLTLTVGASTPLIAALLLLPFVPALLMGSVLYLFCWVILTRRLVPSLMDDALNAVPTQISTRLRGLLPRTGAAPSREPQDAS